MAAVIRLAAVAGALVALPLLVASPGLGKAKHEKAASHGKEPVSSVAYPKAPGGMPAAADKGKPVEAKTDPAASPKAPAKASTEPAPAKTGTSSTAYPGAPGGTPAASDGGKPVGPKP